MNRYQLLASASIMTFLVGPNASQAQSPEIAGAALTAIPSIQAVLAGSAPRSIAVGNDIFRNEEITTGPEGFLHVLFRDESNMTLGPNAKLTIDDFVYSPATGTGEIVMNQTQGIMRFIGGQISKAGNVQINTVVGTIGVRGGIALINVQEGGSVQIFFIFGDEISITSVNGDTAVLTDIGFSVNIASDGEIGAPQEISPDELGATMNELETPAPTAVRVEVSDAVLANLQDRLEQAQPVDPETGLLEDLGVNEPVSVNELETILGVDVLDEQAIQDIFEEQSEEIGGGSGGLD